MHFSCEFNVNTDVNHLGVLIGNPKKARIIAVSTSAVFQDKNLIPNYWNIDDSSLDSGFQGHLYTRPNDVLVVRSPHFEKNIPEMVLTAVETNCNIWRSLTGIQLASQESRLIITSDKPSDPSLILTENLSWIAGNLQDVAISQFQKNGYSFLAFVLNKHTIELLNIQDKINKLQSMQVGSISLLMDKNIAMEILENHNINCAETFSFITQYGLENKINQIPASGRYLFKPSGGAAGIGVYGTSENGVKLNQLLHHVKNLKANHILPSRFQIQKFLPGTPYGVSAGFDGNGSFEIFEIHQQIIKNGRYIGGRWTPEIQNRLMKKVLLIYKQLSEIDQLSLLGLVCLDIIDGKVIEINPRLTASAPISHLLRLEKQLSNHISGNFKIRQIDLNTRLKVSYELIKTGGLQTLIEGSRKEFGVLVLPQGLNPFGTSRFIFINDTPQGSAQSKFIKLLSQFS